jgi:hypothetical protein
MPPVSSRYQISLLETVPDPATKSMAFVMGTPL